MVPVLARQSVIQKCILQRSVLLGNYEFYYLAGLLHKLYGLPVSGDMAPKELFAALEPLLLDIKAEDEREAYLVKLVTFYEPQEEYDSQMQLLFRWGATESRMWQMQTDDIPAEA